MKNRLKILTLGAFVFSGLMFGSPVLALSCVQVSGAGLADVNATYTEDGTYGGAISYINSSTSFLRYGSGWGRWYISYTGDWNERLYKSESVGTGTFGTAWETTVNEPPVPTVNSVSCGGLPPPGTTLSATPIIQSVVGIVGGIIGTGLQYILFLFSLLIVLGILISYIKKMIGSRRAKKFTLGFGKTPQQRDVIFKRENRF